MRVRRVSDRAGPICAVPFLDRNARRYTDGLRESPLPSEGRSPAQRRQRRVPCGYPCASGWTGSAENHQSFHSRDWSSETDCPAGSATRPPRKADAAPPLLRSRGLTKGRSALRSFPQPSARRARAWNLESAISFTARERRETRAAKPEARRVGKESVSRCR